MQAQEDDITLYEIRQEHLGESLSVFWTFFVAAGSRSWKEDRNVGRAVGDDAHSWLAGSRSKIYGTLTENSLYFAKCMAIRVQYKDPNKNSLNAWRTCETTHSQLFRVRVSGTLYMIPCVTQYQTSLLQT